MLATAVGPPPLLSVCWRWGWQLARHRCRHGSRHVRPSSPHPRRPPPWLRCHPHRQYARYRLRQRWPRARHRPPWTRSPRAREWRTRRQRIVCSGAGSLSFPPAPTAPRLVRASAQAGTNVRSGPSCAAVAPG